MKILFPLLVSLLMTQANAAPAPVAQTNPLLDTWKGAHGGLPPFDQVKISDFKPALEQGMTEQRKEIEAITKNSAAPTFENTVEAYDRSGKTLGQVMAIYGVWSTAMNTPEFQSVEKEMSPKLAAYQDEISQNADLFKRIDTVYQSLEKSKLSSEQKRLTWFLETQLIQNGARLDKDKKAKVAEINQKLATLYTSFSQNERGDEEDEYLLIEKESDLKGLPASFVESTSAAAEKAGKKGKWLIANTRSSMEPLLTYSPMRNLREKAFKIWTSRGDNDNSHNNNKIVTQILKLRAERSKIFGYETFAHWHLNDTMAKDPKAAMNLMLKVWKPAVAQVHKEVADMQAIVDAEKGGFKIKPWDYRYYAEKVRKTKYDFDFDLVKPYLQLDNIRKAMFWSAGKLYGFDFVQIKAPVYQPTMSVYKVMRKGKLVGLWYFDPYARAGKNSGAWMNNYREQFKAGSNHVLPIVSNNANFIPGKPGEPVLISWDDAVTMFHEFGHALHGLNSDCTYRSISGTNTMRDFVEFPSQFNENYLPTPQVLKFLVNQKGQPLPKAMVDKIHSTSTFNQGFLTVEFLASAIMDMKLHLAGDASIDPAAFEKDTLKELQMPDEVVMRHRIPQFGHVFSGEDYASGYYGYLWAQVLDYDAFEAFTESKGGAYDAGVAKKYRDYILSVGNTVDPGENYRKFRGRDATVDAFLKTRGFPLVKD